MSGPHSLYVVAYDASDDRERAHVDRVLAGFGFRAQKSVFECRMSRRTRERLRDALRELYLQSGYVLAWRAAGRERDLAIGQAPAMADLDAAFVV